MRVAVVVFACLWSVSCFELERTRGLGEGVIHFRVVDGVGSPVAGAVVSVDGVARVSTSNDKGLVEVDSLSPGDQLLRVAVDDDADGSMDRAAIVSTGGIVRAEFTPSFSAPVSRLTADVLGDVVVTATGSLTGSVAGCALELCRVVVFREVLLGRLEPRSVDGVVEASAGVGVDGSFVVPDVAAGPVKVAAFSWPRPSSTEPQQQMIAASRDVSAVAVVDAVVSSGEAAAVELVLAQAQASVQGEIELGGEVDELERATGEAVFVAPQSIVDVDAALVGAITGPITAVDLPLGVFDVSVALDGGLGGSLLRAVAVPGVGRLVPIETQPVFGCRQFDGKDDCDGDGKNVDDDDDDDGDGQLDVDEPAGCRGPGLGTDLDQDCLCEPADPFPGCASNDPVACELVVPPDCEF